MRLSWRKAPAREPLPRPTMGEYSLPTIAASSVWREHVAPWLLSMHWDTLARLGDPNATKTMDDVRRLQGEAEAYRGLVDTPLALINEAREARAQAERQGPQALEEFDGSGLGRVWSSWERERAR